MADTPTPILMITSIDASHTPDIIFQTLKMGALDSLPKKDFTQKKSIKSFKRALLNKIKSLSLISKQELLLVQRKNKKTTRLVMGKKKTSSIPLVALAASTGGPPLIQSILKAFPEEFSFCLLLVQHITPSFLPAFVSWLESTTDQKITTVEKPQNITPGHVFIAPQDHHLVLSSTKKISALDSKAYKGCRPSANLLFSSLAKHASSQSIGVILTGMGEDGLEGLKELNDVEAPILAQDKKSCAIYGMPKACIDAGLATCIAPSEKIASEIIRLANFRFHKP
jgi:two-component system chemotaxis response regulator CheB